MKSWEAIVALGVACCASYPPCQCHHRHHEAFIKCWSVALPKVSLPADRQLCVLNENLGQDCEVERPSCDPWWAIVWMCGHLRGQQVAVVGFCMFEMSA